VAAVWQFLRKSVETSPDKPVFPAKKCEPKCESHLPKL